MSAAVPGDVEPEDDGVVLTRAAGESAFAVHSLQPEYNEPDHGLYVRYIQAELNKPAQPKKSCGDGAASAPRPRNLALTGSYGSGKSSILSKVVEEFGDRVISVSMSTLGSEEVNRRATTAGKDPLETPAITNSIQKEIVKQLLYREEPWKVPGSRYKRIERFRHWRAIALSVIIAAAATVVALLAGWLSRVETFFNHAFWPIAACYAGGFVLILLAAYALQAMLHNRVRVEKLTSGPASVSLSDGDKSESFFDKYLDELVYFFEANDYDIVIFEDLDRFNDPYIFETLRELNTLLNNSKQVAPNVITFVYAIKDSIFEQLGKLSINGTDLTKEEIRRLAVTNRTKFFDLVIPVVPFISHRNARDLVGNQMKQSGFVIEKTLVDLVSRHLVDMRLIKNVHNEYGIFEQKILGPGGVDGLDRQRLFAMVVYKNLHMTDFEKVKEGTSSLDAVFADYRTLVNQQIASADEAIRLAQARLQRLGSIGPRSKLLGDQLVDHITMVLRQSGASIERASMTLSTAVSTADLRTSAFWSNWLGHEDLVLQVTYSRVVDFGWNGRTSTNLTLDVTLADVRAILDDSLDAEDWKAADEASLRSSITSAIELREFLRHASMKEVAARLDLTVRTADGARTFVQALEDRLGQGLALDLIKAGYVDRNFSLYVSLYYDDTVTARARNYLLHAVESNKMDIHAEIGTGEEVEAMLEEAGDAIFAERSLYNIQIFDHLLSNDDSRVEASLRNLTRDGDAEREFLASYFSNGAELGKLVARLAPLWSGVLRRVMEESSFDDEGRMTLVDSVLRALSNDVTYDSTPALRAFVQDRYRNMPSLLGANMLASPDAVSRVLVAAGIRFASLAEIGADLKALVIANSLYELTQANLVAALDGEVNLSLDNIRAREAHVFDHVIENLAVYLEIYRNSDDTPHTIANHTNFISVLNELVSCEVADVEAVVDGAVNARVLALGALEVKFWPTVARAGRLKPSYANVHAYVEKVGAIDDALAATLNRYSSIEDLEGVDAADIRGLALELVNSTVISIEKRVELALSLGLSEPLLVADLTLTPAEPELVGQLLAASLIEDSAASYDALASEVWPIKRAYVLASATFADYMEEIDFTKSDLQSLMQDERTPAQVKRTVLLDLQAYEGVLSPGALVALANVALSEEVAIGAAGLRRLGAAGVAPDVLIRLIDRELETLGADDLVAILATMPSEYRRLTTRGGHTKLPNTAANVRLVDRLKDLLLISSRDLHPTGDKFRVNLRQKASLL